MAWTTEQLEDKPIDLFEPDSPARGVIVFLHGYDGAMLKQNSTYTTVLNQLSLACVCPHGPGCWWTDTIYPEFDPRVSPIQFLAEQIPPLAQRRWNFESSRIGVTGVEMGGQGALQLVYRHARTFSVVAAISPKVDFETWYGHGTTLDQLFSSREDARQATATLHLHPLNWPRHQLLVCDPADQYCIDGVLTLASKLGSSGIPFESDFETTHGGFGWNYANAIAPKVLQFLFQHIHQ